jgi:hypothetical protein
MPLASRRTRGCSAVAALALVAVLPPQVAVTGDSIPEATAPIYAIRIAHEATAGTLQRLLDDARARLSRPACQQVLDDFAASDGRSLRSRLEDVGCSPEAYLELMIFYDGSKQRRCLQKGNLAVTHVGGRVVYVCPEELRARARRNPAWAEAALIHEALHSLGLGENPPSSQEITAQVLRRCRR